MTTSSTETAANIDPDHGYSPRHLAAVDALRGIAAVSVVILHVVEIPHLAAPHWLQPLIHAGGTGVQMFFVVSAFTLSISWFSRKDGRCAVQNFYIRRIFRIVPLFYALLLITLLRDYRFHQVHSIKEVLLSLGMVFNLVPGRGFGIVWVSWTIGVEMLFYLMFPLLIKFMATKHHIFGGFCITLLLAVLFYDWVQHSQLGQQDKDIFTETGIAVHLPVFVLGLVAFSIFGSRWFRRIRSRWVGVTLIGAALTGHIWLAYGGAYGGRLGTEWSALIWVPLLLGLTIYPARIIVNAVSRFYGKISYSVYLNHPIVLVMLLRPYGRVYRYIHDPFTALVVCVAATFLILTPWAFLTYRFIEQPGIRFGSRLIKWISQSTIPAPAQITAANGSQCIARE